jgi:hypothetical protein
LSSVVVTFCDLFDAITEAVTIAPIAKAARNFQTHKNGKWNHTSATGALRNNSCCAYVQLAKDWKTQVCLVQ